MDEVDITNDRAEADLQRRIDAARRVNMVQSTGLCLYCGTSLEPGARWCDVDCRDDWEKERRR